MTSILERIGRAHGDDLVDVLAALPASDLSSLMLAVSARRAGQRTPADLVAQYENDRFVRPGRCDPRVLHRVEGVALASAPPGYEPMVLPPVVPLGTSSVVATASQNKILGTLRNTEVVSDASNLLALECAVRRKRDPRGPPISLCASGRMTRAQALERPEFTAHFQLFVTVRAGRDPGGRTFEREALIDALSTQVIFLDRLRSAGFPVGAATITVSPDGAHHPAATEAAAVIRARHADVPITIDGARIAASGYYRGLCFSVWVTHAATGQSFPLGDGGLTDWVAKLTGSRKERFLVGAIGLELIASVFSPT